MLKMINFRSTRLQDLGQIQQIEKEYYEGFSCPEEILKSWLEQLSDNFIVAEENGKIIAFIFSEYLDEIKAIPFIHALEHRENGKFVYISEIGILDEYRNTDALQQLFDKLIEKSKRDNCEKIIWLTGQKQKHDKIETNLLLKNNFTKTKNIKNWEAYPDHFVDDHWLWEKQL